MKLLCSEVYTVGTLLERLLLHSEAKVSKLSAMLEQNGREGILLTVFTEKIAELFHRVYVTLDEFADAMKVPD